MASERPRYRIIGYGAARSKRGPDTEVNAMKKTPSTTSKASGRTTTTRSRAKAPAQSARRRKATAATPNGSNGSVSHERIAEAAYYLFLSRGGQPGLELEDWYTAERLLQGHE